MTPFIFFLFFLFPFSCDGGTRNQLVRNRGLTSSFILPFIYFPFFRVMAEPGVSEYHWAVKLNHNKRHRGLAYFPRCLVCLPLNGRSQAHSRTRLPPLPPPYPSLSLLSLLHPVSFLSFVILPLLSLISLFPILHSPFCHPVLTRRPSIPLLLFLLPLPTSTSSPYPYFPPLSTSLLFPFL